MAADTAHWLELKEFDHCEPSALAFRALVALLDTWPADDQAAAIEHADRLLGQWPDSVRLAPWSWCKAASKGKVLPTWPLARALELGTHHLSKSRVSLARLAHHATLRNITVLKLPGGYESHELSFLYHRPEAFPALKSLHAVDNPGDGKIQALADSPLWRTLEDFEIEELPTAFWLPHKGSRIVPRLDPVAPVRHLRLRSPDLVAACERNDLPHLQSAEVFIRSTEEAQALAERPELSRLTSLSIAFRCGFRGSSPPAPFLGNEIDADVAAAEVFFRRARLERLEKLALVGSRIGYWGREGMGPGGLDTVIASGLLRRLKHLRLQLLPLGDKGIAALAPALGQQLQTLELIDLYCKSDGAAALIDSPCLSSLRRLDLSGNRIDAEHFVRISSVPIPHLQSLNLGGPSIHPYYWNVGQQPLLDGGAAAWAGSPNAEGLTELRLANCHLTDEALTAIFQSGRLRRLEKLDLSHNWFTAAAIARAVAGSPLWQTLRELALNDCRLDNAALEELVRVPEAPALRSLQLRYNSIGPAGAAALARWSVLSRVWQLDLHDNFIGDEGLIALTQSPHLGRLLELDLEQDVCNSRTFGFSDRAARALACTSALGRLDGLFSGCVDEYHGEAHSAGFTKDGLRALQASTGMRPAFKACCGDFSQVSDYSELPPLDEGARLFKDDFRVQPFMLNEEEASPEEHGMQQLGAYPEADPDVDAPGPPQILPALPELSFDEEDMIEGIEFQDPVPLTDRSAALTLPLGDPKRPVPVQAGKWLSDTLGSLFRATAVGTFESSGSIVGKAQCFDVAFLKDPQRALGLVREALWWIGAPESTRLRGFPLLLGEPPPTLESRFLQLAAPTISRRGHDKSAYRIDRAPFSKAQREGIRRILADSAASQPADGWETVATGDGGRLAIFTRYLGQSPAFNGLNIVCEVLTRDSAGLIHRLMHECGLILAPMALAATAEIAATMDCDWPKVEVAESAQKLHEVLRRGPHDWWSRAGQRLP